MILANQNKYFLLKTEVSGNVKESIVYLPIKNILNKKLVDEIKIFNKLCLIMPMSNGVAVYYTEQLNLLLKNPKHRPSDDPYEKLLYAYACYVLLTKTNDEIVKRHLNRNLQLLFAPNRNIAKKIKPILSDKVYNFHPQPIYKIFNDSFLDFAQKEFETEDKLKVNVFDSFVKFYNKNIVIKRFENYFELFTSTEQKVTFIVANDKADYDCNVSRSVVTCKNLQTGETKTYTIRGDKLRISTSVCEKTDSLNIYLTFVGEVSVSVNGGKRKLLYSEEIAFNKNVERIVNNAYKSKFVSGEKLRTRYKSAAVCVPTLQLLTAVKEIKNSDDFFSVFDNINYYKKAASLFGGFNIVFLYSSANKFVADLVAGFLTRQDVDNLKTSNVFLFFIDRTIAEPDALYFLTKMTRPSKYVAPEPLIHPETVTKTFPYTRTVTLANKTGVPVNITAAIPLTFSSPSVVSIVGQTLTAVGLYSGKISVYKLPVPLNIENEILTTNINITIKTKLMGFEQKKYSIQRNDNITTNKERKKNFVASLENIRISTDDKQLNKIFGLPVTDGENIQLLDLVKTSIKNVDKKLLISVLEDKNSCTFDVWQFLITKVVGVRLLRGKVHLVPCVNIMGDFVVEFTCNGNPYTFNTKKCLASSNKFVNIMHG